ncbi:hypothetical protein WJX73_002744 [Symbiochloris irregularis]|uniref:Amino acid transporter transmembrane domain-containing protein n=1 Tax=Symbiochloris irregularis TaxID=706552 RepID=A0AAW1PGX0_9CHLO
MAFDGDPELLRKIARGEIATEELKGGEGDLTSALVVDNPRGNGDQGWFSRWLGGDAGTDVDGWLLTVCSQIGQIMLVLPQAFSKMGFSAAFPLAIFMGCVSIYTAYLLVALYCERKARLVRAGVWFGPDGNRRIVSQYHETMGFFLGRVGRGLALTCVILDLLGTNIAQIIASSSDIYYWYDGLSKRTWEIMDAMFVPQNYRKIYIYSYIWIALLTIPHSTAVTLAFPGLSLKNGMQF